MGRRRPDSIDLACREWGRTRRRVLGLADLTTSHEYLGAVRSTLGRRRDLHAASPGRGEQHFPEVYSGVVLDVHRAYRAMRTEFKDVLDLHYVARAPIVDKAAAAHISVAKYFQLLARAKAFVEAWLIS